VRLKINQSKKGWRHDSSGRAPTNADVIGVENKMVGMRGWVRNREDWGKVEQWVLSFSAGVLSFGKANMDDNNAL
jgi:hypothetical protein